LLPDKGNLKQKKGTVSIYQVNNSDLTDEQLTRAAQQGDLNAFEQLILRHQQPLFTFIYRMVNNYNDAEELCQQTLIRAWEKIKSFQGKSSFKTWLFRIGINLTLNHQTRTRQPEPLNELLPADLAHQPEHQFQKQQKQKLISAALQQLPADQRLALTLIVYENLTYKEAAKIMGKSVRAVDSLLVRARARLRTLLEPARKKGII